MSRLPQFDTVVFKNAFSFHEKWLATFLGDYENALQKKLDFSFDSCLTHIWGEHRELAEAHYCNGDPLEKVEESFDAMREYAHKFADYRINVENIINDYFFEELGEVAAIYYLIDRKIDFYDPFSKKNRTPTHDDGAYNLYLYTLLTLDKAPAFEMKKGWRKTWDLHLFHDAVKEKDAKTVLKVLKNHIKRFEKQKNETNWFSKPEEVPKYASTFAGIWEYRVMAQIKYARRHGIPVNYTTNYFMEELMQKYP
jgi:hypothetical protein